MKLFFLLLASAFTLQLAALPLTHPTAAFADAEGMDLLSELPADATDLTAGDFLDLTPKKYREMTGKKMGVKNAIKLKVAQKALKKHMKKGKAGEDIPKGLYIVLAIFGWAWVPMGLMDDWDGNNWWVNLILVVLTCGIGGLIHALIKMKEYY